MKSFDLVSMGSRNLFRRKTRTFLTVLGVIIGTAAIVTMLSLGIGMNETFEREIRRMGSLNIINVNRYYMPEGQTRGSRGGGMMKEGVIDDKTVAKIAAIEGVEAVTPVLSTYPKLIAGKYVTYAQVMGIDISTMEAFEFNIDKGRLLQEGDTDGAVFGSNVAMQFYNPNSRGGGYSVYGMRSREESPVDLMTDKISLTFDMSYGEKSRPGSQEEPNKKPAKLYKIKSIGLLAQSNDEKDYNVYMDINQLKKMMREYSRSQGNQGRGGMMYNEQEGYERLLVKVANIKDVDKIQSQIKEMELGTHSLSDIRKSMQKTSTTAQTVLGGIGAISLLIAAIGITNTMVMSIYERTREIGIMKVLGCELGDIKRLFLFEAAMIGLIGGIIGIALSYGASALINYVGGGFMNNAGIYMGPGDEPNKISVIPVWLAFASIAFGMLIGLISGLYPARRAMKLSALDAIRTE
jgi:putative ABC transport system permease protein